MNNVRSYTDAELIGRVKSLPSYQKIPNNYWVIGVRSEEDAFNRPDDKFYLFKGEKFIMTCKGTTNAGKDLLNPTNPRGEAVLKSNEIYYDCWEKRLHKGKVLAWCQCKPMWVHRDNDRDTKTEELGKPVLEIVGLNFHPMSYLIGSKVERQTIDGWSLGCQCPAIREDFDDIMDYTEGQKFMTYALLKEF